MKIQAACVLAIVLAVAPELSAQRGGRGGGPGGGGPGAGGPGGGAPGGPVGGRGGSVTLPVAIQGAVNRPLPSTPIMPISNPIAPIANPVAPVVPYGGAPGLGVPDRGRPVAAQGVVNRIDRRRDFPVVVIGGPYVDPFYYSPYYYPPYYYQPYMAPPPVPGQLPGVYIPPDPAPAPVPEPVVYNVPPAGGGGGGGVVEAPTFVDEPRMIITPPEPDRLADPPPVIGTSRAEVLMRYGQPWGSISTHGKETLYFRNMTLVFENNKVTEVH